jgi:hypothetical protein
MTFHKILPILVLLLLIIVPTHAQQFEQRDFEQIEDDGVQEYRGTLDAENEILVYLKYLKRGDTIYAYAEADGEADAYLALVDVGFEEFYAQDDNGGGGTNAALTFTVEDPGIYILGLLSMAGAGNYRLVVGINTPSVTGDDGNSEASFYDGMTESAPFDCATQPQGNRPVLSGTTLRFEDEQFVIHFTQEGQDATDTGYVAALRSALAQSLNMQTQVLGWTMPPPDCGEGGDTRLDVYVQDLDEIAIGYATVNALVGDNPNTDVREIRASYGYLSIDNDMALDGEVPFDALDLMRVTAAHEIHHNIQFGYDNNEPFFGFYEAGAVWIETLVFPEISAAAEHASLYLEYPDRCLGSMGADVPFGRIYGEWLLLDSLARDHGATAYQRIWQALAISDGMLAFYNGLQDLGTTPDTALTRMAIRNLLRDYAMGDAFMPVRLESEIFSMGDVYPVRDGVEELGSDYVRLNLPAGVYSLEVNPPVLHISLIGITEGIAYWHDVAAFGTVDMSPYDEVYAIIHNPLQHTDFTTCTMTDWRLRISDGTGMLTVPASNQTFDASRFERPPF